jgi:uncharacterized membrane protein YbhN (UPF0104 family)
MASANSPRPGWQTRSNWLRVFATLLALALVIYLISQQGWAEISEAIGRIQPWRFAAALGLMMVSRFSVVGRWHVLLRSGGVKTNWQESARITFAGLFASNFLPTTIGGDVARMGGALQMGFDPAVSAASLIVDRLVGLAGMVFTFPIGLQMVLASADLRSGSALFALAAENSWLKRMLHRINSLRTRLLKALRLWISQPRALITSLVFTLSHMACLFGAMYLLLEGMHDPLPYFTIAGLWSLVYVITLLPFTINAFGLQEVSITYAFNQLGGISAANSLVLALLVRTLFMLASLPGALFISDILPGVAKAQPLLSKLDQ